jgi:ParB-like chromosome segregation protein Spo0J
VNILANLKIEYVAIDSIKPYEGNAKLHPDEQIEQIKKSIELMGFNDPIAVWKNGEIIEGHGRLIAAQQLGMKKVPIIRLDDLTDEQRRAYALIHNRLTMNSDFDIETLNIELAEIDGIDMAAFSFDVAPIDFDADQVYKEESPMEFKSFDEGMETAHKCPKCGYEWN